MSHIKCNFNIIFFCYLRQFKPRGKRRRIANGTKPIIPDSNPEESDPIQDEPKDPLNVLKNSPDNTQESFVEAQPEQNLTENGVDVQVSSLEAQNMENFSVHMRDEGNDTPQQETPEIASVDKITEDADENREEDSEDDEDSYEKRRLRNIEMNQKYAKPKQLFVRR